MDKLPEPIIDKIYRCKHELEFKHVLDELTDVDSSYLTRKQLLKHLQLNCYNNIKY